MIVDKNTEEKKPLVQIIAERLDSLFDFRYNSVREMPEYSLKNKNNYQETTEFFINSLVVSLKLEKLNCSYKMIDQILNSTIIPIYDPFKEYFDTIPKWNPDNESEIQKLSETVTTTNQPFFEKCLRRWILALVASASDADVVNQQMLILSGGQGLGKSTWLNKLLPQQLKNYYYSGIINPKNKDTTIYLAECLIINLDELSNLNRRESGQLKEIITKGNINTRKAYGKRSQNYTRRSSIVGSTNDTEFLWDITGSRRFLSFEVTTIDYKHEVDIDLVYSEAKYLIEKGEKFFFDREDILEIEQNNESFKVKTIEERKMKDVFRHYKDPDEDEFVYQQKLRVHKIYYKLFNKEATRGNLVQLGRVLKKMNFRSIKVNGDTHYVVYTKNK